MGPGLAAIIVNIGGGWFILGVVTAIYCYMQAEKRGREPVLWAILGFLLPILGAVILLVMEEQRHVGRGGRGGRDERDERDDRY